MLSLVFYLAIFLVVFLLNLAASKLREKHRVVSFIFKASSFIVLVCLFGFRYYVGTDYKTYIAYNDTLVKMPLDEAFEYQWGIVNVLLYKISSIFNSQYVIFFTYGFLCLYPFYRANGIKKDKYLPYSILALCCILIPFDMNGMRQGVAIGFSVLAFAYLNNGNTKRSFLPIIFAILIHKSSVLCLIFMLLKIFIKQEKLYKLCFILSTIIISATILLFNTELGQLGFLSDYQYLLDSIDTVELSFISTLLLLPMLIFIFTLHKNSEDTKGSELVISGTIFDLICSSAKYLSRISLYFTSYSILLVPSLLNKPERKLGRFAVKALFVTYVVLYFVIDFYIRGRHQIFPYQTWIV